MSKASALPAWQALRTQTKQTASVSLATLFDSESDRQARMSLTLDGLEVDFSRTHLTAETVALFLELAKAQELEAWREKMFTGAKINTSENRAVLHTALRAQDDTPLMVDGQNVIPALRAMQAKAAAFVSAVRDGKHLGATGQKITDIVNIGIGGSDLGPRLVAGALQKAGAGPRVHFIANVDAAESTLTLAPLNPATTLFVIVSKTFTTQETLLNARTARSWLIAALGEAATAKHFVAVSTNREAVEAFGIDATNMFEMWDWVGGRYSVWSAVGLSVALAIGWEGFSSFLAGAAAMDQHFRTAPLAQNMPVLMAMTGLFYRNFRNAGAIAILPYSEQLRNLPRFLQQLDMESNGKSVTREGEAVDYATGPIIFGECGSVGQHSFHQWLHQGTDVIPVDFIGVRHDAWHKPEHHAVLLAHMKAQAEALKSGRGNADPARANPGNKPSTMIWLDTLDPYSLGLLLALYEHKVFCQGILWGINSFDQFGVELGKKLASEILEKQ